MLQQILSGRKLPVLPESDSLSDTCREILLREEYGQALPLPENLVFDEEPVEKKHKHFCAGFATLYRVTARGLLCGREFSFPFRVILPKGEGPFPFFVFNDFEDGAVNKYLPAEEIIGRGFAVLHVCYKDVTSDNGDFTNGIASCLYPDGIRHAPDAPGKLAMWAWANSRLMDYAETLSCLDLSRAAVAGHSRLGKTALLTGLLDKRFSYIIANDSGCSGDAISRGKGGEQISDILNKFPYWFCENYKKYLNHYDLPFDQHWLVSALAPRTVLCGAALEDKWADPDSQFLTYVASTPVWEAQGKKGLIAPDCLPTPGNNFDEGCLCYHLREGAHYFSRIDWNIYMDTLLKKFK